MPFILLLFISFDVHPYVQKTFFGYLMPYVEADKKPNEKTKASDGADKCTF